MAKQPRENRVPIMLSDAELSLVDDWRFANRVATRSDAARKLMQIGIVSYSEMDKILMSIKESSDQVKEMNLGLGEYSEHYADDEKSYAYGVAKYFSDEIDKLLELIGEANRRSMLLADSIAFIQQTPDLECAVRSAEAAVSSATDSQSSLKAMRKLLAKSEEHEK